MESPKRKMLKQQDYNRHKFFRKLAKRKKATKERESKAAEKELTRRLKMTPPRYGDGKMPRFDEAKNAESYIGDVRMYANAEHDVPMMQEAPGKWQQFCNNITARSRAFVDAVSDIAPSLAIPGALLTGLIGKAAESYISDKIDKCVGTARDVVVAKAQKAAINLTWKTSLKKGASHAKLKAAQTTRTAIRNAGKIAGPAAVVYTAADMPNIASSIEKAKRALGFRYNQALILPDGTEGNLINRLAAKGWNYVMSAFTQR